MRLVLQQNAFFGGPRCAMAPRLLAKSCSNAKTQYNITALYSTVTVRVVPALLFPISFLVLFNLYLFTVSSPAQRLVAFSLLRRYIYRHARERRRDEEIGHGHGVAWCGSAGKKQKAACTVGGNLLQCVLGVSAGNTSVFFFPQLWTCSFSFFLRPIPRYIKRKEGSKRCLSDFPLLSLWDRALGLDQVRASNSSAIQTNNRSFRRSIAKG